MERPNVVLWDVAELCSSTRLARSPAVYTLFRFERGEFSPFTILTQAFTKHDGRHEFSSRAVVGRCPPEHEKTDSMSICPAVLGWAWNLLLSKEIRHVKSAASPTRPKSHGRILSRRTHAQISSAVGGSR